MMEVFGFVVLFFICIIFIFLGMLFLLYKLMDKFFNFTEIEEEEDWIEQVYY